MCRHFLATLSPDAVFQCTKAKFITSSAAGTQSESSFTVRGKREIHAGFLQVYRTCVSLRSQSALDEEGDEDDGGGDDEAGYGLSELPELEKGSSYRLVSVKSRTGATRAPGSF